MFNTAEAPDAMQQSYAQATEKPLGIGSSMYDSFAQGIETPLQGADILASKATGMPVNPFYQNSMDALQLDINRTPDSGTKSVGDFIGNTLGFALNPLTVGAAVATGGAGAVTGAFFGGAADTALEALGAATPEILGEGGAASSAPTLFGRSAAEVGTSLGRGAGGFAGAMTSSDVVNAYNPQTGALNLGQIGKGFATNLGLGLPFGAADFALGLLLKRGADAGINDSAEAANESSVKPTDVYSPEEQQFMDAYKSGTASPDDLNQMAEGILSKNGIDPDKVNGSVNMAMLTPEDIDNIGKIAPYELASQTGLDFKGTLSDFIAKNALDKFTDRSSMTDGLSGLIDKGNLSPDELQVAKALQRYTDMGKQAKPENVTQHLKDMLDERALQQRRLARAQKAMNDATKNVDAKTAATQGMSEEELAKMSQQSTKSSKPFADAVKDSLKNFRVVKASKEIFDKYINCLRNAA